MIELLVVMAVLGILAAAVLPLSETLVTAQKERALKTALWEIRDAIDRYKQYGDQKAIALSADGSVYPAQLLTLVEGSPTLEGSTKHYFLRRIPRDPFADPLLAPEKTWGLRSYESDADRPREGRDIYDVYSLSNGIALDGSKYSTW
jgi:general secretion pathway protein G